MTMYFGRGHEALLLACVSALVLCSASCAPRPRYELVRENTPLSPQDVEVVTPKDQALQAVSATPTEFLVKFQDDTAMWNRSKLFFARYAGGFKSVAQGSSTVNLSISNTPAAGGRYLYRVSKIPARDGYVYRVECAPTYQQAMNEPAARNAQNVARFIQTGTLEVELLDR